ncbi:MAG TPA: hypothetical protein VD970_07390 [Acetobacteraceae bacterium]|nr:hypothetical protein [Acetobacteraceae bacterium]
MTAHRHTVFEPAESGALLLRFGEAVFRLGQDGAFLFGDGDPLLAEDHVVQPVPTGNLAVASERALGLPVAAAHNPEPVSTPAAIETPARDAGVIAVPPWLPEPPPYQPQAELDLFALFADLYADFDGEQALSALLASDWALRNDWTAAGGAPLG